MKKTGYIVILSGLGLLAYYYLNKKKPTASQTQLSQLQAELNEILAYSGKSDNLVKIAPPVAEKIPIDYELFPVTMTQQEKDNLSKAFDNACPSCKNLDFNVPLSNQIIENLKGSDLVNMKTGLEGFTLKNV